MGQEDICELSNESLIFWLQRFILDIRRKNGTDYPLTRLLRLLLAYRDTYVIVVLTEHSIFSRKLILKIEVPDNVRKIVIVKGDKKKWTWKFKFS